MNRQRLFIFIVIVIVVFVFFNPFGSVDNLQQKIPRPGVEDKLITILEEYILENHQEPEEFVINAFKDHDIIFLGQYWRNKQDLQLVTNLVPRLYDAGITNLGVEFGLYEDQERIDALVTDSI